MSKENQKKETNGMDAATLSKLLLTKDLSRLNEKERTQYYNAVCESVGLNPLTKPFDYIILDGRLTLYARRNATDQLCQRYRISTKITHRERIDDLYMVQVTASKPDGQATDSTGVVSLNKAIKIKEEKINPRTGRKEIKITGRKVVKLENEELANAIMKAETKAKRRAVLALVGLSFLDETEIETIPTAQKPQHAALEAPKPANIPEKQGISLDPSLKDKFLTQEALEAEYTTVENKKKNNAASLADPDGDGENENKAPDGDSEAISEEGGTVPPDEREKSQEEANTGEKRGKAKRPTKKNRPKKDFPYWKSEADGQEYICAKAGKHLPSDWLVERGFKKGRILWYATYSDELWEDCFRQCEEYEKAVQEALRPPVAEFKKRRSFDDRHVEALRNGFKKLGLSRNEIEEVLYSLNVPEDTDEWTNEHFMKLVSYLGNNYTPPKSVPVEPTEPEGSGEPVDNSVDNQEKKERKRKGTQKKKKERKEPF